jgi:hypothetical protein
MIKIHKISHSSKNNLVFDDMHLLQNRGFALLTYYPAQCDKIAEINAEILDSILKLELDTFPKEDLQKVLTEFFVQLNWRLFSMFRSVSSQEKGISVVLIVNIQSELYVIPFGRFICGIWNEKGLTEIGNTWENFRVKSMQDLMLLGNLAEDIKPNIIKLELPNHSGLSVVTYHESAISECNSWYEMINELAKAEEEPPYILISNGIVYEKAKKKFW